MRAHFLTSSLAATFLLFFSSAAHADEILDAPPAEAQPLPAPGDAPVPPPAADAMPGAPTTLTSAPIAPASLGAGALAREAPEREDAPVRRVGVASMLGFGSANQGFGLGVRGGYTMPMNVYVGGSFMYHVGTSTALLGQSVSSNAYYFAGEGGYDFQAGPVTIRPYAGLGYQVASISGPAPNTPAGTLVSQNANSVVVYPAASAHWNIPRSQFFVGGDTRVVIPLADASNAAFAMFGTAGAKF
ncbi:MAG: outer membrane beta-barrel protein [Labilithrix sp.]|nr:outer membrane beta-barrel protein [Labilithrix sp.]